MVCGCRVLVEKNRYVSHAREFVFVCSGKPDAPLGRVSAGRMNAKNLYAPARVSHAVAFVLTGIGIVY